MKFALVLVFAAARLTAAVVAPSSLPGAVPSAVVKPWLSGLRQASSSLPQLSGPLDWPGLLTPLVQELQRSPDAKTLRVKLAKFDDLSKKEQAALLVIVTQALKAAAPAARQEALALAKAGGKDLAELDALARHLKRVGRLYSEDAALRAGVKALQAAREDAEKEHLRRFIADFHAELRQEAPELFDLKLGKAVQSDFAFYRAFPQLYYDHLRRSGGAEAIAATAEVPLAGDLHADNVELAEDDGPAAQVNDFDDSMTAPAGLEVARALGGAALLGTKAERAALIKEAAKAYKDSLGLKFKEWKKEASDEKAVRKAKTEDRDWAGHAGKPVTDAALAKSLLQAAGLDAGEWSVFDRRGAGLSSIGLARYLFLRKKGGHVYELKELRPAAPLFFTLEPGPKSQRPRIDRAYKDLRRVPVEAKTVSFGGKEWTLRRREADQTLPKLSEKASSARLLGGLAAQLHRGFASREELLLALETAGEEALSEALDYMARLRAHLKDLIKEGRW